MNDYQQPTRRSKIACQELREIFRGEERHRRLHGRLLAILVVSLVLDTVVALGLFQVDAFSGENHSFWRALGWTSSQMLVGGSSFTAQSPPGHVVEVVLQVYGVTVIAAIAGAFASYFLSQPEQEQAGIPESSQQGARETQLARQAKEQGGTADPTSGIDRPS